MFGVGWLHPSLAHYTQFNLLCNSRKLVKYRKFSILPCSNCIMVFWDFYLVFSIMFPGSQLYYPC